MDSKLFVRKQSGGMFSIIDKSVTTGSIFWVHSGTGTDGVGYGYNPDRPCATIDYAYNKCTTSKGDIVYVMPGHAETYSAADALVLDLIGVSIIGLGEGALKPTISVDTEHTEEASVSFTGSSNLLQGIRFVGINAGGSKNVISITGGTAPAGSWNTIKDCDFVETSTDKELAIGAAYGVITLLDAAAIIQGTKIIGCTMIGLAGNDESFVSVTDGTSGATDVLISGCHIVGTFADDLIQADAGTNVNTRWTVENSTLVNLGGNNVVITIDTGGVFFMHNLAVFGAHTTTPPIVGYNASYQGLVATCEPGAIALMGVGSATNWGA